MEKKGSPCSKEKALLTLHVTTAARQLKRYHTPSCHNVRLCDALTFLLDNKCDFCTLRCIDNCKLLGFLWARIVLLWLRIYSCFVVRGTSDDKQVDISDALIF